jgi:hypothetical protein
MMTIANHASVGATLRAFALEGRLVVAIRDIACPVILTLERSEREESQRSA